MLKEFKEFAMKGNVLDMAIGVIIGAAFGKIVTSFVSDVLMPPLGLLLGKVDFSNLFLNLSGTAYASLADAKKAGAATLNYGLFLNTVIDFVIVAFALSRVPALSYALLLTASRSGFLVFAMLVLYIVWQSKNRAVAIVIICLPVLRPLRQPDPSFLGDDEKARAAMETLVKRFPRSGEGQGAAANLNELHFQDAQHHLDAGEFDVCTLFYSRFRSVIAQIPTAQQIIPPLFEAEKEAGPSAAYEYEPAEEDILAELLPRNLSVQVFRALLENAASEQGARLSAMDNATRNAGEMIRKQTLTYNRTRQAMITKELIEIISGAEAL